MTWEFARVEVFGNASVPTTREGRALRVETDYPPGHVAARTDVPASGRLELRFRGLPGTATSAATVERTS